MNSIATICKKTKNIGLYTKRKYEEDVQQYISDGVAVYPIAGLPYLTEESILTIFDVSEKEREKWVVRNIELPEWLNFEDTDVQEKPIEECVISFVYGGKILKPLYTTDGISFIESRYLAPMKDVMDVLRLYERRSASGTMYIVAKAGLLLQAVIMPYDAIKETFVEKLSDIAKKAEEAFAEKKIQKQEERQMYIGADTEI